MKVKINNIVQLRNCVVDTIEKLVAGEVDVVHAGIVAKSSETIMSSLKLELAYTNMKGDTPNIKFIQDSYEGEPNHKLIEK